MPLGYNTIPPPLRITNSIYFELPAGLLGPSTALSTCPAIPFLLASNWLPITPSLLNGPPTFSPIWPIAPSGLTVVPNISISGSGWLVCVLEGLRTVLSDSSCARNYTGVRLRNRIGILVGTELVSRGGGVVGHVSGHVGCGLVRCAEAELFLEGTGGFGHLVRYEWLW